MFGSQPEADFVGDSSAQTSLIAQGKLMDKSALNKTDHVLAVHRSPIHVIV